MDEAAVAEVEEGRKGNVVSEEDVISVDDQPSVEISHDRNGVFSCQTCGDAFKGEATYMMHLQQHSKQAEGTCGEAQSNDESEVDTDHKTPQHDFHSQENTPEKDSSGQMASGMNPQQPYHCEECGKSYEMLGHFLNHQKKHRQASKSVFHELEHLKKKSFQCEICGRSYSRVSALDAHRRCHEVKLVKKCRSSPESLGPEPRVEHIKPTENPTEAENTGVEDGYKQGFIKSFECPCGKSFTSLMGLKTHQRFSRNENCSPEEVFEKEKKDGPFKCRHCDKTFSGSTAMLSHERWHSDSVHKYPCEECGKVFMTLTFYERHQRLAHSNQVASKSFLHQVCQLQKKSFECKICGLKFSRASALHSHELHHTEVFKETRLPQSDHKYVMFEPKPEQTEGLVIVTPTPGDQHVNVTTDEDSSEPGDLIVKVISSSESDDTEEDENSDLELVCESDQEGNEDEDFDIHKKVVSKSHMNLKIVQVDYGEPLPKRGRSHISSLEERHDCPDCYRWFTNAASLRVHRMWHGVRRRRQLTEGQSVTVEPLDLSCHETVIKHFQEPESVVSSHTTNLVNFVEKTDSWSVSKREYNPKKTLLGPKIYHCEQCGKGFWSLGAFSHHKQSPLLCTELRLRKGFGGPFTNGHSRTSFKVACPVCGRKFRHKGIVALHMRRHENGDHKCDICNRSFRLLSGLLRHRAVHNNQSLPPPIKSFQYQVEHLQKNTYSCPDCGKLFSREKALQFHMKSHGYESGYSPPSHRSADTKEDLQCSSCFAVFNKKSSLRAHRKLCTKSESNSKPQEQDSANVTKTESKTKNEIPLENDIAEESKYKCKVCERSFSVVGALNFHKRIHTESHKALTKAKAFIKKSKQEDSGKGPFSCSDCGRRFVSNSALGSHKRWHRDKPCAESSQDSEELSPDTKKAESGRFECSKCHKKFFNLYVLQRHQLVNAQCQNAEQKTAPAVSVENKLSAQQDTYSCTECDQSFGTSSLLDEHIKDVHSKPDKSGSSVKAQKTDSQSKPQTKSKVQRCPICSMSFRNVRGLRAHKWQVHSDTGNTETKTENNQSTPKQDEPGLENEASSEQTHANDSPTFQTNTDVKLENNPDTHCATLKEGKDAQTDDIQIVLSQHHSELKTKFLFKCDKCGKAFSSQQQLDNHKTKAKRRPFSCALCCSGFWTENQLQQHFIWHDKIRGSLPNELRFRINAATALAASVYTSDRSISTLNDPVLIPDDKAASCHECQNCGKGFLSLLALQKHKRECCKTGPYHCSSCPSTFSDVQELIEHHQECAAAVQSGGYYSCLECEATFSQKNDLHQHYTEHATCVYVSDKT